MTHLRTTCPRCRRQIDARAGACFVDRLSSTVWLVCRACGDLVGQPARGPHFEAVLSDLVRSGGHVVDASAARHPESSPGGPALSLDDLISLHQLLQDDFCVATAVGELAAEQRT
jgi:hypothetical protein